MPALARPFAVLLAGTLAASREARASQCFVEPAPLVLPTAAAPAPRNTHVRVRLHHGPRREDPRKLPCDDPLCDAPGFGLALRPAGAPEVRVTVTQTKVVSGETAVFDLRPTDPLSPNTRYEVYRTDVGGRDLRLLSTFTTGELRDETPPAPLGPLDATFHPFPAPAPPPVPFAKRARPRGKIVYLTDMFPQLSPYVSFAGELPVDESTRAGDLAFFVWSTAAGPSGRALDYAQPPDAIVFVPTQVRLSTPPHHLFFWGAETSCDLDTLLVPRPAGLRRIGVRVVDLAGNQSAAQEREIDFGK